jgi:hypothetical protein
VIHLARLTAFVALISATVVTETQADPQDDPPFVSIAGDYYDWTATLKPEQPWMHDYSQTLVMKITLCHKDSRGGVGKVYLTFEQALEVIRKLDNLTLGIPKIVYLVGWQFTGHDSGYPSWGVVNQRLKRLQDDSAVQSLRWLLREAKQYHTTVSLHINMTDAYESSPLWQTYLVNNVILKDAHGNPIGAEQAYQISYAQEWKLGFAQRRIDELLQMLPELREAGTIHIDAFHSVQPTRSSLQPARSDNSQLSSPYVGFTINDEIAAQRKIIRYWRSKGLDVTAEDDTNYLKPDPFIGLQPMAWHFDPENFRLFDWVQKPRSFVGLPPALYSGTPMPAEIEIMRDPQNLTGLVQQFCQKVVPWYYANNTARKEEEFSWSPNELGVFVPALWRPSTVVACGFVYPGMSQKELDRQSGKHWRLPASWGDVATVKLSRVTVNGSKPMGELAVHNHIIDLALKGGEVFEIDK